MTEHQTPTRFDGPNTTARRERDERSRRTVLAALAALVLIVGFFAVTSFTGLPGPGGVRRYPTADLQRLADQINHSDSCGGWAGADPVASVDWFRSRVHLTQPFGVGLAPEDEPMVDNPPVHGLIVVPESRRMCVGMSLAG